MKYISTVRLLSGAFFSVVLSVSSAFSADLPAFPGAQGHGSKSVGGSGRHLSKPVTQVFSISNLQDSGPGSLRECAEAKVPRVCIFETSGRIHLKTEIRIKYPYLTIAGQTAPSPGIMVTGSGVRIAAKEVVVQHISVRPGDGKDGYDPSRRDGVTVGGGDGISIGNVIVDHVSVSWAIDENIDVWNPLTKDVTISNTIAAEGLEKSIHPEGGHSKGIMVGENATRVSIHNSLLAHNWDRNPRLKAGCTVEFTNNVVYNYGGPSGWNGANVADTESTGVPIFMNFIGNYYKPGKSSPRLPILYAKPIDALTRVYALANYGPTRLTDSLDDWLVSSLPSSNRAKSAVVAPSGITTRTASAAYTYVLANVGSRPKDRSASDKRIIAEVQNGTGDIKDCVAGCTRNAGGWPEMKIVTRKLTLPADPNGDANRDGYTNLENWLHGYSSSVQ